MGRGSGSGGARAAALAAVLCTAGCTTPATAPATGAPAASGAPATGGGGAPAALGAPATADPAALDTERAGYEPALARARAWLDGLTVDPAALRAMGIKGKKKVGELLHTYLRLLSVARDDSTRAAILARITAAAAPTYDPAFHDLPALDEKTLREDATSYLRVCYLMEKAGLDTRFYRAKILEVVPLLNAHIATRGVHQRRAFEMYYDHFGIPFPPELRAPDDGGVIARHADPATISREDVYQVTHEVFVPYDFGFARSAATPFPPADLAWLRAALPAMMDRYRAAGEVDLLAELAASTAYLGYTDLAAWQAAVVTILHAQSPDGSFGHYDALLARFSAEDLKYRLVLHTTMVSVDALVAAFEPL